MWWLERWLRLRAAGLQQREIGATEHDLSA